MVVTNDDMVAGAVFDFASWLTARPDTIKVGASNEVGVMGTSCS